MFLPRTKTYVVDSSFSFCLCFHTLSQVISDCVGNSLIFLHTNSLLSRLHALTMKGRLTELVIVSIILLLSLVSLGLGSAYAHQAVASPKDLDNDDAWAMTPNPTTA